MPVSLLSKKKKKKKNFSQRYVINIMETVSKMVVKDHYKEEVSLRMTPESLRKILVIKAFEGVYIQQVFKLHQPLNFY